MKELSFRPLRRLKSGKIAVAGYMQWRTLHNHDWRPFELLIRDEYKAMPQDEQVHNHKGEPLFFYTFDPSEIPLFNDVVDSLSFSEFRKQHKRVGVRHGMHGSTHYMGNGIDCDGVPTFSHFTASCVADNHFNHVDEFEPLTVSMVLKWWGWILYRMDHVRFKISEPR